MCYGYCLIRIIYDNLFLLYELEHFFTVFYLAGFYDYTDHNYKEKTECRIIFCRPGIKFILQVDNADIIS